MRKIILDFYDVVEELIPEENVAKKEASEIALADTPENKVKNYRELVHDYIADKMDFPKHYGNNLDALYDCLTDISEPTAVGFFIPTVDFDDLSIEFMMYLDKVRKTFLDAETDNRDFLAVIAAEGSQAVPPEGDPDEELEEMMKDLMGGIR